MTNQQVSAILVPLWILVSLELTGWTASLAALLAALCAVHAMLTRLEKAP